MTFENHVYGCVNTHTGDTWNTNATAIRDDNPTDNVVLLNRNIFPNNLK